MTARRFVRLCFLILFVLLIASYLVFQSRNFINGPQIAILEPTDSVHHDPTVMVRGTVRNITYLSLNGTEIHTTESGDFSHELVLENGYTIMTLYATDRFGRETSVSRPFVYVPASTIN